MVRDLLHDGDGALATSTDGRRVRTPWRATQRTAWEALKAMSVLGHGLSTSLHEDYLPCRMMRMSHT
jgi:hypothetical protein